MLHVADLSQRRASTSVDRWSVSESYDDARPCRHRTLEHTTGTEFSPKH